jgi:hypothetical protein
VAAGCITRLRAKLREKAIPGETLHASSREGWHGLRRWGRQVLTLGVRVAIVSGVLVSVLAGVGQVRIIQALATFTFFFGLGLLCSLSLCLLLTLSGIAAGAFMAWC